MKHLKVLLENKGMQSYLETNLGMIDLGAKEFAKFPSQVKKYVKENLHQFVGKTVNETYENISIFTSSAVHQFLSEVCGDIVSKTK